MEKIAFEMIKNFVGQETVSWGAVKEIRRIFESSPQGLLNKIEATPKRTIEIIKKILSVYEQLRIEIERLEPGHGIGHMSRDYVHALIMSHGGALPNVAEQHVGFIAGVFHDLLGCSIVNRYDDHKRAVKHAEASGLFLSMIGKSAGLSIEEMICIAYAMSAHTQYLKSSEVKCGDGIMRQVDPYMDLDDQAEPISCIWFPRWVDRLDVNGPAFVGRHYLTQVDVHADLASDSQEFYQIKFADHMVPSLRSADQIKMSGRIRTMREHLQMYHNSQNSESVYGKFDPPIMIELRESYKKRLKRIIDAIDPKIFELWVIEECGRAGMDGMICSDVFLKKIVNKWTRFLHVNIEPSDAGEKAAEKLEKMFFSLPIETQEAWANGFRVTMEEYDEWSKELLDRLQEFPKDYLILPIIGDVREVIK